MAPVCNPVRCWRAWLSGAELDRQVSYWARQLKDAPPLLELPLDHPRPPVQRYRGAWISQTFSPELLSNMVMGTTNTLIVNWAVDPSYPIDARLEEARRLFDKVISPA